jgi:hypothetical protein
MRFEGKHGVRFLAWGNFFRKLYHSNRSILGVYKRRDWSTPLAGLEIVYKTLLEASPGRGMQYSSTHFLAVSLDLLLRFHRLSAAQ